MPRRVWLSLVTLATGVALMVVAQLAGAAPERKGGIFKVGTTGASVQIDPQLAYVTTAWWLEDATAAKLYNYRPGGKLVPEIASRFRVSQDGRRYTFFIRKGFRFSDGTPVIAASFEYAIDRVANHDLASPGAQFITDPGNVDIAGAKRVNDGNGTAVSGVRAVRNKLIIELNRPSKMLVPILTMPFFQATSKKLPLDREIVNVDSITDIPSAGPYALARNEPDVLTSLRRNPYWTRGPGRVAPRNLVGLDLHWNLNEQTAFEMVKANQLDEAPIPAAEVKDVANEYGVNRSQFWVEPTSCISEIAFNNHQGLFLNNVAMRRAFNWALDRTDYTGASFTRTPWTHLLPPGYPGSITKPGLQPYAPTARIEKARRIAAGHFKDGRVTVYYRSSGSTNQAQGEKVRRTLINLGFDPAKITMKGFTGGEIYTAVRKGSDFDLAVSLGWCSDYPNTAPGDVSPFLPGPFFPNNPNYLSKIAAAMRLKGSARATALGRLDLEITRKVAPVAVTDTFNNLYFFSSRVDPRSLRYHRVYRDWSIPAFALK
jgi:peptide/nickel transport system substrate-binding protein